MKFFMTQIVLPTLVFAAAVALANLLPEFAFWFAAVAAVLILTALVGGAIELRKAEKEGCFEIEKE